MMPNIFEGLGMRPWWNLGKIAVAGSQEIFDGVAAQYARLKGTGDLGCLALTLVRSYLEAALSSVEALKNSKKIKTCYRMG